ISHPFPTTLTCAGIHILIKSSLGFVFLRKHFVIGYIWVPHIHVFFLPNAYAKQLMYHVEHSLHYFFGWKPRAQLFFRNTVALFTQTFAPKTYIPRLKLCSPLLLGKSRQFGKLLFCLRFCFASQIAQKGQHPINVWGHFSC